MAFFPEERAAAERDSVNLAKTRVISISMVTEEVRFWERYNRAKAPEDQVAAELAWGLAGRMYGALGTAHDLALPEKYSDPYDAYRLIARGELASDYAFSRLMRALLPHLSNDDYFIDESPEIPSTGAVSVIVGGRILDALLPNKAGVPRIGEWWHKSESGQLHVRSIHPAPATELLLRRISSWYKCSKEQARHYVTKLGFAALQPYVSASYVDADK